MTACSAPRSCIMHLPSWSAYVRLRVCSRRLSERLVRTRVHTYACTYVCGHEHCIYEGTPSLSLPSKKKRKRKKDAWTTQSTSHFPSFSILFDSFPVVPFLFLGSFCSAFPCPVPRESSANSNSKNEETRRGKSAAAHGKFRVSRGRGQNLRA